MQHTNIKQHTKVTPRDTGKETIQLRIPAWIWRQTKAQAAMRTEQCYPGDLVAEALISHLGLQEPSTKRRA